MGYLSDLRFKDLQLYCKPCVEEKPHGVAMKRYVNTLILKIYETKLINQCSEDACNKSDDDLRPLHFVL